MFSDWEKRKVRSKYKKYIISCMDTMDTVIDYDEFDYLDEHLRNTMNLFITSHFNRLNREIGKRGVGFD